MAYDIGPVIGIEGEKEFRDSIKKINSSMRTLGLEAEVVATQYAKGEKSANKLKDQNTVLNRKIKQQKELLGELNKGLEKCSEEHGEADKKTEGWKQSVLKATINLNKMEQELKENVEALNELEEAANRCREGIDDTGDSAEESAAKHSKLKNALRVIGGGVGKAAAVSIAAVGTAAIATAKAAFTLTKNTREYRTDLSKLKQNAKDANSDFVEMKGHLSGLTALTGETDSSIEALSNLMATGFGDNQIAGAVDALSGAVIKFPDTLKIESLADGLQETLATGEATGQFAELIERSGGSLEDFNKKLGEAQTEAEKQEVALSWLAESGLAKVNEQYKEANKEMLGAAESEFKLNDAMAGLADAVEPSIAALKGGAADVLTSIVGMVTGTEGASDDFKESLGGLVEDAIGMIGDLIPVIASAGETIIPALVTGISEAAPQLVEGGLKLLEALIKAITSNIKLISRSAVKVVLALAKGILKNLPLIVQGALQLVIGLATGIAEALPELIPAVIEAVLLIVQTLIENLPLLIDAALQLVQGLVEGLLLAMPMLMEQAPVLIQQLVDGLVSAIPMLTDTAIQLIMALVEYLTNPDNLVDLVTGAISIITAIGTGLIEAIPELLSYWPELISSMIDKFKETDWGQVGKDIIDGVAEGIKKAASTLWDATIEAARKTLVAIKNFLGIKSPSTKMRDEVGLMMGYGIADGIEASYGAIDEALQGIDTDVNINPRYSTRGTGAGGGGFNNATTHNYNRYDTNQSFSTTVNIQNSNDRLEWERKMKRTMRQQAAEIAR